MNTYHLNRQCFTFTPSAALQVCSNSFCFFLLAALVVYIHIPHTHHSKRTYLELSHCDFSKGKFIFTFKMDLKCQHMASIYTVGPLKSFIAKRSHREFSDAAHIVLSSRPEDSRNKGWSRTTGQDPVDQSSSPWYHRLNSPDITNTSWSHSPIAPAQVWLKPTLTPPHTLWPSNLIPDQLFQPQS